MVVAMFELGPSLFAARNARQWGDHRPVVYGDGGMNPAQTKAVETRLRFALPPDFINMSPHSFISRRHKIDYNL